MKGHNDVPIDSYFYDNDKEETYESEAVQKATDRMRRILDAEYEKADLKEVIKSNKNLDPKQQK